MSVKSRKKLIEVALPLEAINEASAREKSIRHGHPSTLHLWWARRPLAAARAVIFAQMVDDPSEYVDELISPGSVSRRTSERELRRQLAAWSALPAEEKQNQPKPTLETIAIEIERQRLFSIIGRFAKNGKIDGKTGKPLYDVHGLVDWAGDDVSRRRVWEASLEAARREIWSSWRRACAENVDHPRARELFNRERLPSFHDPFAGGGALPLEAQRLGLEAYASDLNPVAVLINKAMIEIPPKFAGMPPVHPDVRQSRTEWSGAQGLAEDVRYYGQWMRDEAEKRIGHLYPKVRVTPEMVSERPDLATYVGKELTVIAWVWARTVKSPNPAFRTIDVPLASTFILSTKTGREAYVEAQGGNSGYQLVVKVGKPIDVERAALGTTLGKRAAFRCLMSDAPVTYDYIREEGKSGRMGTRLMAIVAEGGSGRVYISPLREHEESARRADPAWSPDIQLPNNTRDFKTPLYGINTFAALFTLRQLTALTTFSDLVAEARDLVKADAEATAHPNPEAYAMAAATYLAFAVDKCSDYWSSICTWHSGRELIRNTFGRQAIPMTWDFAETNPFSDSTGNWSAMVDWTAKALAALPAEPRGDARSADAATQVVSEAKVVSTDPPYYDNIGYADLSDFFYIWLRRSLRNAYPELFATIAVPKAEELVATPYRHGGKDAAEQFFLKGMTEAMHKVCEQAHPAFPVTIYYAFKQSETTDAGGQASTGWETFLEAVIRSGFALTGTWPIRTELANKVSGIGRNMLASSVVLVCRRRESAAPTATRREFLNALQRELPKAIADLQRGNVLPVDLQQASIGPGMAVFTQFAKVLDSDGKPLSVRDALSMINQALDETLAQQEGDFDGDTRWALAWFEQFGFAEGEYGTAEVLSKAKATSVQGVVDAGIAVSGKGKVRLLKPEELPESWTPEGDKRLTVWDMVHHLIRVLEKGESQAAELMAKLGTKAEPAKELAYRLFSMCDRKKRSEDAQRYNGLVQSWPEIVQLSQTVGSRTQEQGAQGGLFDGEP